MFMCVTRGRDSGRGTPASLSKSTPRQYENPMSTKSRSTSTGTSPADTPDTPDTEDSKKMKMKEVLTGEEKIVDWSVFLGIQG